MHISFYDKFIIRLYMFRAVCAHHQEVRIVLYSIWYHHTCRWPSRARDGHLQDSSEGVSIPSRMPLPAHHTAHTRGEHPYDTLNGIRTHYLSGRAVADLLLRPRNHRDRRRSPLLNDKFVIIVVMNFVSQI